MSLKYVTCSDAVSQLCCLSTTGLSCTFWGRPTQCSFHGRHSTLVLHLTLNIPSLARQRCLPSWGPRRTPCFFCNFSTVWCGRLLKWCFFFLGFWNYNSVIQALLASNILCLFISTEVTRGTELLHTHSSLIQHLNNVVFWALSAGHFSNLQHLKPKNNKNNNIPHL